jgi:hypothetical protein
MKQVVVVDAYVTQQLGGWTMTMILYLCNSGIRKWTAAAAKLHDSREAADDVNTTKEQRDEARRLRKRELFEKQQREEEEERKRKNPNLTMDFLVGVVGIQEGLSRETLRALTEDYAQVVTPYDLIAVITRQTLLAGAQELEPFLCDQIAFFRGVVAAGLDGLLGLTQASTVASGLLASMGFSSIGPVAGSFAASVQTVSTAAGSCFALAQSAGMTGVIGGSILAASGGFAMLAGAGIAGSLWVASGGGRKNPTVNRRTLQEVDFFKRTERLSSRQVVDVSGRFQAAHVLTIHDFLITSKCGHRTGLIRGASERTERNVRRGS